MWFLPEAEEQDERHKKYVEPGEEPAIGDRRCDQAGLLQLRADEKN